MKISSIDPRDQQWEQLATRFRVVFTSNSHGSTTSAAREYELEDASLEEVLAWAKDKADAEEGYTVSAVVDQPGRGLGVVYVSGAPQQ